MLSGADGEERLLRVDLDTADFGYAVGEVEALVDKEAEVPAALEKIHHLSSLLGEGDTLFCTSFVLLSVPTGPIVGGRLEAISLRGIILAVF